MRREVHFQSLAFNISEPREYFINECCFGDDLCKWLISKLQANGIEVDAEPGQEDFGWYLNFNVDRQRYCLLVAFQPNDETTGDQWLGWVERDCGMLGSFLGGRKRNIDPRAVEAIDIVLRSSREISNVSWRE